MSFSPTPTFARSNVSRLVMSVGVAVSLAGPAPAEARPAGAKAKCQRVDRAVVPPAAIKRGVAKVRAHGRASGRKVG